MENGNRFVNAMEQSYKLFGRFEAMQVGKTSCQQVWQQIKKTTFLAIRKVRIKFLRIA